MASLMTTSKVLVSDKLADVGLDPKETKRLEKMFDYVILLRETKGRGPATKEIKVLKPVTKMKIRIKVIGLKKTNASPTP